MLKALVTKLRCPNCRHGSLRQEAFSEGNGHIENGVLTCAGCGAWYPIYRDVLQLVPAALLDRSELSSLRSEWGTELDKLGLVDPPNTDAILFSDQRAQAEHFNAYADNSDGLSDYTLIPCIRATSRRYIEL